MDDRFRAVIGSITWRKKVFCSTHPHSSGFPSFSILSSDSVASLHFSHLKMYFFPQQVAHYSIRVTLCLPENLTLL